MKGQRANRTNQRTDMKSREVTLLPTSRPEACPAQSVEFKAELFSLRSTNHVDIGLLACKQRMHRAHDDTKFRADQRRQNCKTTKFLKINFFHTIIRHDRKGTGCDSCMPLRSLQHLTIFNKSNNFLKQSISPKKYRFNKQDIQKLIMNMTWPSLGLIK